jgi:hypothetical protein
MHAGMHEKKRRIEDRATHFVELPVRTEPIISEQTVG